MIDIHSVYRKLKKSYFKNLPEFLALKNKLYPDFVFESNPRTLRGEIPVFTLHSVDADRFEEQLVFLSRNGYQTLTADEFYECLIGGRAIPERAILLTFDDGLRELYAVAHPLLQKHGMRAVCFLIPGLISYGEANSEVIVQGGTWINGPDSGSDALCNWQEIKEMHGSGVVDFQSHSLSHHLIFTSPDIQDFFHPFIFDPYARNVTTPLFRVRGEENVARRAELGTPVYDYASRFSGKNRYFDDENLRNKCVEYVKLNGGEGFFKNRDWRRRLMNLAQDYRRERGDSGRFEDDDELRQGICNELRGSKRMIEKELPGKPVNHFCYPWWEGSGLALEASKEAGYLTNFWGILPGRRTNRRGDDPYRIARLLSDDYIFRLPGVGRKSLPRIIREKFSLNYGRLVNKLLQRY